jgi:hypothetical protein
MNTQNEIDLDLTSFFEDRQSKLERMYIEEFLKTQGYSLHDMLLLPDEPRRTLMTAACRYASTRLAEIEQRAHFVDDIRAG